MARPKGKQQHVLPIVIDDEGNAEVAKLITAQDAIKESEVFIRKNVRKYLKKLHELAMGITIIKETKNGPVIYQEKPDIKAIEMLIDRGLGKTPQRYEVTGDDGGPMEIIPWMPAVAIQAAPEKPAIEAEYEVIEEDNATSQAE